MSEYGESALAWRPIELLSQAEGSQSSSSLSLLSAVKFFNANLPSLNIDESDSSELGDETSGATSDDLSSSSSFSSSSTSLESFRFLLFCRSSSYSSSSSSSKAANNEFSEEDSEETEEPPCRSLHEHLVPLFLPALHYFLVLRDQDG